MRGRAGETLSLLFAGSLAAGSLVAQPAPDTRMQAVMDRAEFVHASWGMEFYDLAAKKTLFAVNRDRLFVPGSTTKIVTMGAALETLGANHRFRTRVFRTGPVLDGVLRGDLVLVAVGDPNLSGRERPDGSYAFVDMDHSYGGQPLPTDPLTAIRKLAQQVAARGIRTVAGQVIVDASLFREGSRELGTRVVLSPIVINDNLIDIVVMPGARVGDAASVTVSPRTAHLTVVANIITGDSGRPAQVRSVEDSTDRDHRTLVMTGTVPLGPPTNPRWVVPSPTRFGEIVFAEALHDAGVRAIPRLGARTVDFAAISRTYADSTMVAEHVSLPLTVEARVLLKTSQNLHASNFPLLLGALAAQSAPPAANGGPIGASPNGFDIARTWMERAGLDLNGAVQGDGAGGDAFFSPAFMTRFLEVIAGKPWAAEFRAALPVLGTDGTLAAIQVGAPAAGRVSAKTGTFSSVDPLNRRPIVHGKGLAGYFTSKSGKEIAFAIYLNNFAANVPDPAGFAGQALGEIASIAWDVIK